MKLSLAPMRCSTSITGRLVAMAARVANATESTVAAKTSTQHADAEGNDRAGHGAHAVDEAAMVVEAHARICSAERLAQLRQVGRGARRDPHDDEARHRQIVELQPASQPRLEQARRFLPWNRVAPRDAGRPARAMTAALATSISMSCPATGTDLDRHLARHIGLPFARRGAHQHDRARRQRGEKGHDGDDRDQGAARQSSPAARSESRSAAATRARRSGRRVGPARLLRFHRRVIRRHAGDLRAARDGVRRTDPSARRRGWR